MRTLKARYSNTLYSLACSLISFSVLAMTQYSILCELRDLGHGEQAEETSSSHSTHGHCGDDHTSHSHRDDTANTDSNTPTPEESCCSSVAALELLPQSPFAWKTSIPIATNLRKIVIEVLEPTILDNNLSKYYLARLNAPPLISLSHIPTTVLLI